MLILFIIVINNRWNMFNKMIPNLMVENVNKTLQFYHNILGFDIAMSYPESGELEWGMVSKGNLGIMFQNKNIMVEQIPEMAYNSLGGTFTLYIDVENVDEWYNHIRDKVLVVKYLYDTFYGTREFMIKDNNGYFIVFAQHKES